MSTLRGFSSIVAALVGVFGLLASSIGHSSESQIIAIENAGSATLDDQSFHLPLLVTRQLGAFRATDFSMIGARVLRYSNQGELLQAGSDDLVRHQMDRFEGLVAATGGLMFGWSSDREFAAFTSEGTILWTHPAEGSVASPPLVSDAGSIYFVRQKFPSGTEATLHLVELLRDGSQAFEVDLRGAQGLSLPQLELVMTMRLLPVPNSDEMVLVGNMNSHTAIALRIRPDGSVRWYWKAPGRLRSLQEVPSAKVLSDGSLLIGVLDVEDLSWDVHRISGDGQSTSFVEFSTGGDFTNSLLIAEGTGLLYHLNFAEGGVAQFVGRDATGQVVWSVDPQDTCRSYCYFDTLSNGDLIVAGYSAGGTFRLERYSRSGSQLFSLSPSQLASDAIGAYYIGETSEGEVLVSVRRQSTASQSKIGSATAAEHDELMWLDLSGEAVRTVRQPPLGAPSLGSAHLATTPGGSAVLVSPSTDFSFEQASIVAPNGTVLQSELAPRDTFGSAVGSLVSSDRLVVAHRFGVRQYADLGAGALLASTPFSDRVSQVQAFANGNVLVQVLATHPEFDDVQIPRLRLLDTLGDDIALPAELLEQAQLLRFNPSDVAFVSTGTSQFRLSSDGSVQPYLEPFGEALWEVPQGYLVRTNTTLALTDGDKLIFQVLNDPQTLSFLSSDVRAHMARLAPDGTVRWRQAFIQEGRIPELDLMFAAVTANAQGQILLTSVQTGSNRVVLRAIDGGDGSVVTRRVIDCPGIGCEAADFTVDALGQVQGVSFGGGPTDLDYTLIRIDGMFDRTPTLPVAAASGLWYALDTTGEGMAFQYDAASNVLAASWYTYSRTQENEPKQLRWYTLAGEVDPDGDEVALDVFDVQDGEFDSPPAVPATAVGEAQLRLVACDRLEVRLTIDDGQLFGFDSETGIRDFTLSRLIPGQVDCVDRQGHVVQPAGEYDTRVTGAWYEPASSGQGLFLYRFRPEGQDDFVFAGAWFAHDPAGSAGLDDPSPHWFTLLGSSPSEGSFAAEITQTLGGHFGGTRTRNSRTIGSATLTSQGCDRLQLAYQFEDSEEASAFAARSGSIELQRIAGTCAEAVNRD